MCDCKNCSRSHREGLRDGDYHLKPMVLSNCKCRHCTKAMTSNKCYYAEAHVPEKSSRHHRDDKYPHCPYTIDPSCVRRAGKANYLYKCFPDSKKSSMISNYQRKPSDGHYRRGSFEHSTLIDEGAYWSKRLASLTDVYSQKTSAVEDVPQTHNTIPKADKGIEVNVFVEQSNDSIPAPSIKDGIVQAPETYQRLPMVRPKSANLERFKERNFLIDNLQDTILSPIGCIKRRKSSRDPSANSRRKSHGVMVEKGTVANPPQGYHKATMVDMIRSGVPIDRGKKEKCPPTPKDFHKTVDNVPSTFFASSYILKKPSRRRVRKRSNNTSAEKSKRSTGTGKWSAIIWEKLKHLHRSKHSSQVMSRRSKKKSRSSGRKMAKNSKVHRHRRKKTQAKFTSTTTINELHAKNFRDIRRPMVRPKLWSEESKFQPCQLLARWTYMRICDLSYLSWSHPCNVMWCNIMFFGIRKNNSVLREFNRVFNIKAF